VAIGSRTFGQSNDHTAHRTPHTAHRTPHTAHRTPHTAHRTPHTAYYSDAGLNEIREKSSAEIARVLRGERPHNVVNQQWLPEPHSLGDLNSMFNCACLLFCITPKH
jgi:hypothetical protein